MASDRKQNKVFTGNTGNVAQADQVLPPELVRQQGALNLIQQVKDEFGIDVPDICAPLPSMGLTYPVGSALHGVTDVVLRAMTTKEENILTSQALIKRGTVINELIKSLLVEKTFNVEDLLLGDRNALMVAARASGYGAAYEARVKCSADGCGFENVHTFDLSQLDIKRLELTPVSPGMNLFEFQFPKCKLNVRFKFFTARDELEASNIRDREEKAGIAKDDNVTKTVLRVIRAVQNKNGDWIENSGEGRTKIEALVSNLLSAEDATALRLHVKENEPGINMKQEYTCSKCGNAEEVEIPIGTTFLWPASK